MAAVPRRVPLKPDADDRRPDAANVRARGFRPARALGGRAPAPSARHPCTSRPNQSECGPSGIVDEDGPGASVRVRRGDAFGLEPAPDPRQLTKHGRRARPPLEQAKGDPLLVERGAGDDPERSGPCVEPEAANSAPTSSGLPVRATARPSRAVSVVVAPPCLTRSPASGAPTVDRDGISMARVHRRAPPRDLRLVARGAGGCADERGRLLGPVGTRPPTAVFDGRSGTHQTPTASAYARPARETARVRPPRRPATPRCVRASGLSSRRGHRRREYRSRDRSGNDGPMARTS